jgi:hypothetical protein
MRTLNGLVVGLCAASLVGAVTIHVPGDQPTIQAGLDASQTGDTVLVAAGTYTGAGNTEIDFGGRDVVLLSAGGPDSTIIDGQGGARGFYFHNGETAAAEVIGFTIYNGFDSPGGGVYIENSGPTFRRCIISGCNTATQGGGVNVVRGTPAFYHCVLHGNHASEGGGMSATSSSITVTSCIVAANTSSG